MADDAESGLIARAQAGEHRAFAMLVRQYQDRVFRFILRLVGVRDEAMDLTQETFMKAHQALPGWRPEAQFRTWLFTLAHHRLVDHLRTAKHHTSLDASDDDARTLADTLVADSGFGPVRQLQSREQAAALIAAVEQLPLEQREAFLLQAEGDLSVQEIAEATGVNFETAKSRLRYARASLRQHLKEFV